MANAEHCSQSPMSCQHASRFAEKLLEAHPKHCLMPDAWRVAAMGREAAPQKGTFREWRCAGDIPKSCLVTDGSRCIGANQARKLGAADPMAASEKARQTNLRIGGLTRLAAPGREFEFDIAPVSGQSRTSLSGVWPLWSKKPNWCSRPEAEIQHIGRAAV